jgi:hypothetical protein
MIPMCPLLTNFFGLGGTRLFKLEWVGCSIGVRWVGSLFHTIDSFMACSDYLRWLVTLCFLLNLYGKEKMDCNIQTLWVLIKRLSFMTW